MKNNVLLSTVAASLMMLAPAFAADTMEPEKGGPSSASEDVLPTTPSDPNQPAAPHEMPTKGASTTGEDLPSVPAEAKMASTFANKSAMGDLYEVKAAEIAKEKSANAEVKALADMIAMDHTAALTELTTIVAGMSAALPSELDADHQAMIDALNAAPAGEFDMVYVDQQVTGHKEALALHRMYASDGDTESLKTFAAKVAPKIEMHLTKAMALQSGMNKSMN